MKWEREKVCVCVCVCVIGEQGRWKRKRKTQACGRVGPEKRGGRGKEELYSPPDEVVIFSLRAEPVIHSVLQWDERWVDLQKYCRLTSSGRASNTVLHAHTHTPPHYPQTQRVCVSALVSISCLTTD